MKKIFAIMLVLIICLFSACGKTEGKNSNKSSELKFSASKVDPSEWNIAVGKQSEITILKYTGEKKEVHVPSELGGQKIERISSRAFAENKTVEKIVIQDGIKTIEGEAFRDCANLDAIVLPDTVSSIGSFAFSGCNKLAAVVLPKGLVNLESGAFCAAQNLSSVKFAGNLLITINSNVFCDTKVTDIEIPSGVMYIETSAFPDAAKLTITIPKSVVRIEDYAMPQGKEITIKGFAGTEAERYATENNNTFVDVSSLTK